MCVPEWTVLHLCNGTRIATISVLFPVSDCMVDELGRGSLTTAEDNALMVSIPTESSRQEALVDRHISAIRSLIGP